MANKILKDLTIDGVTFDAPQGGAYTAGDFIDITNGVISADDMRLKDARNSTLITAQYSGAAVDADYIAGWGNYKIVAMDKATSSTAVDNSENSRIASTAFVQKAINNRFAYIPYVSKSNVSLPNNAQTRYLSWKAPSNGKIIGVANATFPPNATGVRHVATERDGTSLGAVQWQGASNGKTVIQQIFVNNIDSGQELKVRLYQNSGSAMTVELVGLTVMFIPII